LGSGKFGVFKVLLILLPRSRSSGTGVIEDVGPV